MDGFDSARRFNDQHKSVRNHILLVGRASRVPRNCRLDGDRRDCLCKPCFRSQQVARGTARHFRALLALRRWGLVSCVYRGLCLSRVTERGRVTGMTEVARQADWRLRVTLPAPTAWPVTLAFGISLIATGLVTSLAISALGIFIFAIATIGWFRDIFPCEREEEILVEVRPAEVQGGKRIVDRLEIAPELARAVLPLEIYPVSSGVRGGLAGGIAMAVLACTYGVVRQGSVWYPVNLLAATVYGESLRLATLSLREFHLTSFLIAIGIHLVTSLLVGLLYGAMLPMFPRRPIALGGLVAPVLWTGLIHSVLALINPLLNQQIDWVWFIASQIGFGITAGVVVLRHSTIRIKQPLPLALRAGVEVQGYVSHRTRGDKE